MFHAHYNRDLEKWEVSRGDTFLFYIEGEDFAYVNRLMRILNKSNEYPQKDSGPEESLDETKEVHLDFLAYDGMGRIEHGKQIGSTRPTK